MSKKKPFNNAFEGLKALMKEPEKPKTPTRPPPRVQERPGKPAPELDEAALFRQAVGDVAPVRAGPKVVTPDPKARLEDKRRVVNEEEEALMALSELVAGQGPFTLTRLESGTEGAVGGLDARVRERLRAGDYPVQAQLDLHGLSRLDAKAALERFIHDARMRNRRCVLVVHGRGLHSDDATAVLKAEVPTWLTRGRTAGQVLAFTPAKPDDGGAGALYVLVRQR